MRAYRAKRPSVTTTIRKMIVMPTSRMFSAISFGVLWRCAPSTMAIMRSRKLSPGFAVTRTLSQSDTTRVPPVTAERSPPLSRMTGADSPVIADSSDRRDALDDLAVRGNDVPSLHQDDVAGMEVAAADALMAAGVRGDQTFRHGFLVRRAQAVGARLAPALGHRFGEGREQHREPEPGRDLPDDRSLRTAGNQRPHEIEGRQDGHHLDDEHHRVADQRPRIELADCDRQALSGQPAIEKYDIARLKHCLISSRTSSRQIGVGRMSHTGR